MNRPMHIEDVAYCCCKLSSHLRHMLWAPQNAEKPAGDLFGEPLPIHKQSCYFFGRERRVADVPTDHPSCSKQHAILQYRYVFHMLQLGSQSMQKRRVHEDNRRLLKMICAM